MYTYLVRVEGVPNNGGWCSRDSARSLAPLDPKRGPSRLPLPTYQPHITPQVDWETHDVKVDAEYNMRRAAVEARLVPGSGDRLGSTGAGAAKRDDYANGGQTFSPSLTRKSDERGLASGSDVTTTPWRGREKQVDDGASVRLGVGRCARN